MRIESNLSVISRKMHDLEEGFKRTTPSKFDGIAG